MTMTFAGAVALLGGVAAFAAAPKIDGKPDDACWAAATWHSDFSRPSDYRKRTTPLPKAEFGSWTELFFDNRKYDLRTAPPRAWRAIQKHVEHLRDAQRLRRIGPDKGGRWEVAKRPNGHVVAARRFW